MAPAFHMEALLPSSVSPKIGAILQSHVYPRVGRVFRALARFKAVLLDALSKTKRGGAPWPVGGSKHAIGYRYHPAGSATTTKHSIWSGGSSARAAEQELDVNHLRSYYESTSWSMVAPAAASEASEDDCGYLSWLEEETPDEVLVVEEGGEDDVAGGNEIDRLAEKFIARCHAKFLLEKQESYRRYQEMMARSM